MARRGRATRRGVIGLFDPWGSPLCTCPRKYSLNPYTGCSHFCLYCYATAYIGVRPSTPKPRLLERLRREIETIDPRLHIDIATSSDPYPPEEEKLRLTRSVLELLLPRGYRVLVITKGSLVARDRSLLAESNTAVTMTVTTLDTGLARRLEPGAPPPGERVAALKALSKAGVPVGIRLDPLFPFLTDDEDSIRRVLEAAREAGARFVVVSTYKARPDNLRRMLEEFPELETRYTRLYREEGRWMHGYWYLPARLRRSMLERARRLALELGYEFATCREGFPEMHTAPTCDGSHMIPKRLPLPQRGRLTSYLGVTSSRESASRSRASSAETRSSGGQAG